MGFFSDGVSDLLGGGGVIGVLCCPDLCTPVSDTNLQG